MTDTVDQTDIVQQLRDLVATLPSAGAQYAPIATAAANEIESLRGQVQALQPPEPDIVQQLRQLIIALPPASQYVPIATQAVKEIEGLRTEVRVLQTTPNQVMAYYSPTAPMNPANGTLWFDSNPGNMQLKLRVPNFWMFIG